LSQFAFPNGGFQGNILAIYDEEKGALWIPNRYFGSRQRGAQSDFLNNQFFPLWKVSGLMAGNPGEPLALLGQDISDGRSYEPNELGIGGMSRPYFIRGTCKDSVDAPLGGAVVQGFRTSDDLYVGQIESNSSGVYELPTVYLTDAHYLVAYYDSGTDLAGTTVNTIIPAL
jgi:hypothetical protein